MGVEINIVTNPPDVLRAGTSFVLREGQSVIKGEIVIEDGAEFIFPDTSSLVVE